MKVKLSELLKIYKESEVLALCKKLTGYDLNEKNLSYEKIEDNWKFVGNNPSNGSVINMLRRGEKGLIERITNAVDAVLEKKVKDLFSTPPIEASSVIKKAFPKYYEHCEKVRAGEADTNLAKDAVDQVIVAVSDSSRTSRPTYDILDAGTGIIGDNFANTILSINKGNKLSNDNKRYLIGAFGQGGSTSLSFASATIIISKVDNKYWFTIVRQVDLADYKNVVYVYLTLNGSIQEAENDLIEYDEKWINNFINNESGTLVRMVETNISSEISSLDAAKPHGLQDYICTELFDVGMPVTVIENRKNFSSNEHKQNRIAYGSALKLCTWKKYQKYSGSVDIDHNGAPYRVDYYVILPSDEEKWANDSTCKSIYKQINTYEDPIIYTVNGQAVSTEGFTKIKNGGLNQLKYRLLIVINLDLLGKEKYKFFTTDRSQIKATEDSKGLINAVVEKICKEEKLIEFNSQIAGLALNSGIDEETASMIASKVKSEYASYLKYGGLVKYVPPTITPIGPKDPKDYADRILYLNVIDPKHVFYKNEEIVFKVNTGADKYVNKNEKINVFLDNKSTYCFEEIDSKGIVTFKALPKDVKYGNHTIQFGYYDGDEDLESLEISFEVLNEDAQNSDRTKQSTVPNIEIYPVFDKEFIIDLTRNEAEKKIEVMYNNTHQMLYDQVYGKTARESDLKEITDKYLMPMILFVLFMGDKYEEIASVEEKNQLIVNFIKAQLTSYSNN